MEVKKFEEFVYTDEQIEKYRNIERKKYFVSTIDDDQPYFRTKFDKIEDAIEHMDDMNENKISINNQLLWCIYESNFRIMSEDELDVYRQTDKYNL